MLSASDIIITIYCLNPQSPLLLEDSPLFSPIAMVLIGGLISSTALNLVVLPAAYAMVRRPSVGAPS